MFGALLKLVFQIFKLQICVFFMLREGWRGEKGRKMNLQNKTWKFLCKGYSGKEDFMKQFHI